MSDIRSGPALERRISRLEDQVIRLTKATAAIAAALQLAVEKTLKEMTDDGV